MKDIIGVIGTIASGKDTVADYIVDRLHIQKYEISQPLKDIALERGMTIDRENLIKLGREIANEYGSEYLAKILLEKIDERGLISGMRQVPQIQYLKDNCNLVLISVDAFPKIRFERSEKRGKAGEAKNQDDFVKNEQNENSGTVQRLFYCMRMADYCLENNTSLDDLTNAVEKILFKENLI